MVESKRLKEVKEINNLMEEQLFKLSPMEAVAVIERMKLKVMLNDYKGNKPLIIWDKDLDKYDDEGRLIDE